jgi:hypothetical protein
VNLGIQASFSPFVGEVERSFLNRTVTFEATMFSGSGKSSFVLDLNAASRRDDQPSICFQYTFRE